MDKKSSKWLYWAPRALGILFILFVSVFALDVFDGSGDWGRIILALTIHLIPSFILLAALLVAWRWKLAGGLLYILLGVAYLVMTHGRMDWTVFMVIPFPAFLVGVLFVLDNFFPKIQLRNSSKAL